MCEKPPASFASLIGVSLVTIVMSAWISDPVASVAMKESIFITTTTTAFTRPIASPISTPTRIASSTGMPPMTSFATATPVSVITNANERSKTRAVSGIVIASAARPVIAFVLRICFAVPTLGNVSGTQSENTTMIASQT